MSTEGIDFAGLLGEKGLLSDLFSLKGVQLSDAEAAVQLNAIKVRYEKKIQERENEKKREQQKQDPQNSDKTQDLAIHTLLTDILRAIEVNNERLRTLEHQQEALGKHLALLLAGEPIELNEDGSLQDPDAEAAVREYEVAKETTVDRTNPVQIQSVMVFGAENISASKELDGQYKELYVDSGGDRSRFSSPSATNSGSQSNLSDPVEPVVDAPKF